MADYSSYGKPSLEWEEFARLDVVAPTGLTPGQSIEALQTKTNASREIASAAYVLESGMQEKVSFTDFQIPTQDGESIPARVYRPMNVPRHVLLPVYLYFHGGGFLFGTLSSEDANCERIIEGLDIAVVNVCYRHTPQFKHPTQANDAWDAFQWTCDHLDLIGGDKDQLIIGGTSAGGSLAAAVVVKDNQARIEKNRPSRIKGQVLCIPQLYFPGTIPSNLLASEEVSSYNQHVDAPVIPRTQLDLFKTLLFMGEDESNVQLFVGDCHDQDIIGMPKTSFLVAGMDPLRDEALLFADRLKDNGVLTKVHMFKGLPHGFYRYSSLPSTDLWFSMIIECVKWSLSSENTPQSNLI